MDKKLPGMLTAEEWAIYDSLPQSVRMLCDANQGTAKIAVRWSHYEEEQLLVALRDLIKENGRRVLES